VQWQHVKVAGATGQQYLAARDRWQLAGAVGAVGVDRGLGEHMFDVNPLAGACPPDARGRQHRSQHLFPGGDGAIGLQEVAQNLADRLGVEPARRPRQSLGPR